MTHLTETMKRLREDECECTTWRISEDALLDPPHVRRIFAGKRVPKLTPLWKLAAAFCRCSKRLRASETPTTVVFRMLLEALARDVEEAIERDALDA